MKPQELRSDLDIEYQNLLEVLAHTGKYLEVLNSDPVLLQSYRQLLRFLRSRPPEAIAEILRGTGQSSQKVERKIQPSLSEEEIRAMPIQKILDLASTKETPRKDLEQIASVRFGVTRGGLSALRSRDALGEKIRTLVSNENAHASITRAAGQRGVLDKE
jgi:hypothetical protein